MCVSKLKRKKAVGLIGSGPIVQNYTIFIHQCTKDAADRSNNTHSQVEARMKWAFVTPRNGSGLAVLGIEVVNI